MKLEREFFYDEVRDGFYIPGIIKRTWAAELTVLAELDRICKKYDIPYYAVGGTLLGAVRDGNFIPWDDDIDIMMLRSDYNRFVQVVEKELPEEMGFRALEINHDFYRLWGALGKQVIGFESEVLRKYYECPFGVSIDIFKIDELPINPEDEELQKNILNMFSVIFQIIEKNDKSRLLFKELQEIETLLQINFDRGRDLRPQVAYLMDRIFQEYNGNQGEWLAVMPFYFDQGICKYPKSAFDKSKRIPFCGMELPIPGNYDAVLKAEFGDYHKKVKAGGIHDYPCTKTLKKKLQDFLGGEWDSDYHFSEEDLVRPKIQNFRDMLLSIVEFHMASQKQLLEEYVRGDISSCLSRLSAMQEEAIALGNAIEQNKGEGSKSVSILEEYCEALYHAYQSLIGLKEEGKDKKENKDKEESKEEICFPIDFSPSLQKELQRTLKKPLYYLKKLRVALKEEFKKQVVFLPHTVKHFASLCPLVDALLQDEEIDCKIIPIPYYDKYGDGTLKELHYEGKEFPKEYKIIDYRSYDFSIELPDCIVINSPYDEYNPVWTVDSAFYSKELKKYTNKLVYLPWFITDEIDPKNEEDGKAFTNMEYYVTVPGPFHSDLTIVQSEGMKKAYLAKIKEFAGKDVAKKMEKKIAGAGSCLLGDKEGQGIKKVVECVKAFALKK